MPKRKKCSNLQNVGQISVNAMPLEAEVQRQKQRAELFSAVTLKIRLNW